MKRITKVLSVILILSLMLVLAACNNSWGSLKLESFTVDRSTIKTEYFVGEEINFSGIKAFVKYSDETLNKEYTFADLTIKYDDNITATVGTKNVKVSFTDPNLNVEQSVHVVITVSEDPNAVKHDSYVTDSTAMKTEYIVGEEIDFTGIKIIEKFTNGGADQEITDLSKVTYEGVDNITATAGIKTITVKYNGENAGTISIKVSDPAVDKNDITDIVVGGSYTSTYEVGAAVDLTGLTVTLTYEDDTVRVLELSTLTIPAIDTSSVGNKTVVITFIDPINNEDASASLTITVIAARPTVSQFEKDTNMNSFDSDNAAAGTLNYGDTGFSGQFIEGGKLYVIGDDNAFKFVPSFSVLENGLPVQKTAYYTTVDMYLHDGNEYIALTKSANPTKPTEVSYYDGQTLVAVVDTYNGSYQFKVTADKIKISVLPSEDYYKLGNTNPVVLEAKVIDAFNVYAAWQLAVIDNDPDADRKAAWDELKTTNGILNLSPAGIVFHNDIHISADDVPASFFKESTADIIYKDGDGEETIIPAGTKYLIDGTEIYIRVGGADFTINGNFFTLDVAGFPLVNSPAVFGDTGYGGDFSNATLFRFETLQSDWQTKPDDVANISVENLAIIGNASRDSLVDKDGNLVSAGGLIFTKSCRWAVTSFDNVIGNSFFITYFPDTQGDIYLNKVKCYDSYQNAGFIWSGSTLDIKDSFFNGAGGPLFIAQSVTDNTYGQFNPILNVTNSVTEGQLTGNEIWFAAVNAQTIVGQIKALGSNLGILGTFINSNDKMNIIAGLMTEGSDAAEIITDFTVQGTVNIDGNGIERWMTNDVWKNIVNHPAYTTVGASGMTAPFLTVFDADGNAYSVYTDGVNMYDMMGRQLGTDASHATLIAAFQSAEYITLSQGGLSVVFEFYHYN